MTDGKLCCRTCAWWIRNPQNPNEGGCQGAPPTPIPMTVQHRLTGQTVQMFKSVFPATGPDDFCGAHKPNLVIPAEAEAATSPLLIG